MNEVIYIHNTADQKLVTKDTLKDCGTTARWATATKLGHMMPTNARFERATSETTVLLISYYLSSIQAHSMMLCRLTSVQSNASQAVDFSNVLVPNKGWALDKLICTAEYDLATLVHEDDTHLFRQLNSQQSTSLQPTQQLRDSIVIDIHR